MTRRSSGGTAARVAAKASGWTEISAVCTDPAYRRQGLATGLVRAVALERLRPVDLDDMDAALKRLLDEETRGDDPRS